MSQQIEVDLEDFKPLMRGTETFLVLFGEKEAGRRPILFETKVDNDVLQKNSKLDAARMKAMNIFARGGFKQEPKPVEKGEEAMPAIYFRRAEREKDKIEGSLFLTAKALWEADKAKAKKKKKKTEAAE